MTDTPTRQPAPEECWRKHLSDYNEGLGLVYERFVLNDYLDRIVSQHNLHTVLEAPIFGMAGVSGINSVRLAQRGCAVTLVDDNAERLREVERIWGELGLRATFVYHTDFAHLPFPDRSFDLAWEWAALWYLPNAEALLRELVRVSRNLVFVAMPNRVQIGYLMRKYLLEREFVKYVDESWADIHRIKRVLREALVEFIDEGVLDIPPWPDTVMPAAQVLKRLGIQSSKLDAQFTGAGWNWSTMDYYLGRRPELKAIIDRYTFLERAPIPWQIKAIWAHHRYVLAQVKSQMCTLQAICCSTTKKAIHPLQLRQMSLWSRVFRKATAVSTNCGKKAKRPTLSSRSLRVRRAKTSG